MNQPFYKKLFAFGIALLLVSFPILVLLEVETSEFVRHLRYLSSEEGVVCLLFVLGLVLTITSFILRKFNTV